MTYKLYHRAESLATSLDSGLAGVVLEARETRRKTAVAELVGACGFEPQTPTVSIGYSCAK